MSENSETVVDPIEEMGPTKSTPEHVWLRRFIGEWTTRCEMTMPDGQTQESHGTETIVPLGDLWVTGEAITKMPDGHDMVSRVGYGYDVSFRQYVGYWVSNFSSHLWKYAGSLSEDGATLTLDCVGPSFEVDGETANYRGVIEFQNDNHWTLTSYGQGPNGEWGLFMTTYYERK